MRKSIGRSISILHRQAQIYINHALKEFNITFAEYAFLLYLYRKEGITQDELSAYLHIDKAATARAVISLEEKGYIKKDKDPADKRCNRVYLTDKAIENKDQIRKRVWQWSEILTEDIDENTKDILISALESMVKKVEQVDMKKDWSKI